MDEVTRPGWAARRACGSRSVSASALRAEEGDTSDDSLPSSANGSDDEASDDDEGPQSMELPVRTQDPRATRRSTRSEANKTVNYSRKHHPQDHGLPGHQSKARRLRRLLKKQRRQASKEPSPQGGGASEEEEDAGEDAENEVVVRNSDDEDEDLEQQDSGPPKQPSKPRKRLRMLSDDRSSSPRKSANQSKVSSNAHGIAEANHHLDDLPGPLPDEDTGFYLNDAMSAINTEDASPSDSIEAVQNLNGLIDAAHVSSSSGGNVPSLLTAKQGRPIAGVDTFVSDDTEEDPQDFADQIASQYHYQAGNVEDTSVDEDDPTARACSTAGSPLDETANISEEYDDDIDPATMFQPQSLVSIAAGRGNAGPQHEEIPQASGATDGGVLAAETTQFGGPIKVFKATPIDGDEAMTESLNAQAESSARIPISADKSAQNMIAPLTQATKRNDASSSTLRANPPVESSSSTFRASSRVNSRGEPMRIQLHAEELQPPASGLDGDIQGLKDSQSDLDALTAVLNVMSQRHQNLDVISRVEANNNDVMSKHVVALHPTGEDDSNAVKSISNDASATKVSAAQPISPATSFQDEHSKPETPVTSHEEHEDEPHDTAGVPTRSQIGRESSRLSLQSPKPTPQQVRRAFPLSQQGRGGTLLYSDPDEPAMTDDVDFDPVVGTDPSSPSKLVDVI